MTCLPSGRYTPIMPLRKILLRITLWSLIVAAAVGAAAALFYQQAVAWRVIGTAISTSFTAAILIPLFMLVDKPRSRASGFVGVAALLAIYVLVTMMIWELCAAFGGRWSGEEECLCTIGSILATAPPAMLYLFGIHTVIGRIAGFVGTVLTAFVFVCLVLLSWAPYGTRDVLKPDMLAGVLSAAGAAATAALVGVGTDRRHWRWIGVAMAAIGAGVVIYAEYHGIHESNGTIEVIFSIAIVIAHANLAEICPLIGSQRIFGRVTILFAAITFVFLDIIAIRHLEDSTGMFFRAAAATGIIASFCSLAMIVLAFINRKVEAVRIAFDSVKQFTLICPVCGTKQTLPVGESRCCKCRLVIRVQFEEPHCPKCNYVLLMLPSDRCPECGEPIINMASPQG